MKFHWISMDKKGALWNKSPQRMVKKAGQKKVGKTLGQTKDQTPLLPLSGTRKVVRTPTNPFETAGTVEVFVVKEIIDRRIQDIFDHYLVVWEGYPLKKDYSWEPIENLYGRRTSSFSSHYCHGSSIPDYSCG
jgi:hypothetical protein